MPRDQEIDEEQRYFGNHPHGDFFVAPIAAETDGHRTTGGRYFLRDTPGNAVVDELEVPNDQVRGVPVWDAIIDTKTGGTLADLVASGFLAASNHKLTQPRTDPQTKKEKLDTIGCIEARGALIGHVASQARLLAENWTDAPGHGASAEFDPRWFGLTFKIGTPRTELADTLARLFPPVGDRRNPRAAAFEIAKSDTDGAREYRTVELFNPVERWFENAQPRLSDPRAYTVNQSIRLAWDLEPRWGDSLNRYDDPEFHLLHYAVQRHIVLDDGSRLFHATWLAKGAETIDVSGGARARDYQLVDPLDNLPEALRNALFLLLSKNSEEIDVLQQAQHREACRAWVDAFHDLDVDSGRGDGSTDRATAKLVYTVVPIDNSGTKGDPSPPISLMVRAPRAEREAPFKQVSLSFGYLTPAAAFPRSLKDRPTRLTMAIQKSDLDARSIDPPATRGTKAKGAKAKGVTAPERIELYFDGIDEPRSGIFGADLLDADRHRHRTIAADASATATLRPGGAPTSSIVVDLLIIDPDQKDPAILPELRHYYLKESDFDRLIALSGKTPDHTLATQIYARWETKKLARAAPWTRCDLKLRISRPRDKSASERAYYDDFISPIAEFEPPLLSPLLLLPEEAITTDQGLLYRTTPVKNAVLDVGLPPTLTPRDAKKRGAIRLTWTARPQRLCDGSAVEPDQIGGFDLFVASRDRETDTVLSAEESARLALPLGRVLVKPRALLNSEPAQIEDFSKLDVAYPSAASIAEGRGWYSAAESRPDLARADAAALADARAR